MNNVRMVKLGDLCEINPRAPKLTDETLISFVSMSDLSSSKARTISETSRPYHEVKKSYTGFQDQDILIAKITPCWENIKIGIANIKNNFGFGSTEFHVIRASDEVTRRYLLHFLRNTHVNLQGKLRMTGSGGQKRVPAKFFEDLQVPLPSLEEQKRIVSILDKAKSIQEARERQLITFDRLKHSLLQETIKSSIIQEIPVGKVISLKNGSFLPAKKQDGGKFPVYGGNGVNGSHSQYMVEEPTIIIGRVGAYCGSVHITRPKSWVTDNALIVTIQTEGILQKYLAHVLHSINLNQYANRSGQPSISATRIKDITIPIVPLTEQEKFTKNINNIDRQIYLIRKSLEEDKALFVSLQSVLFDN